MSTAFASSSLPGTTTAGHRYVAARQHRSSTTSAHSKRDRRLLVRVLPVEGDGRDGRLGDGRRRRSGRTRPRRAPAARRVAAQDGRPPIRPRPPSGRAGGGADGVDATFAVSAGRAGAGSCSLDASDGFAAGVSASCDAAICFCRPTPSTTSPRTIASADAPTTSPTRLGRRRRADSPIQPPPAIPRASAPGD